MHRDVKPENILLSANGIIKICDFGVSRMFSKDRTLDLSTEMGTVWYQAPEMLMNSTKYDATVDIWSVGKCTVNEYTEKQLYMDIVCYFIGILFTELVNKMPLVAEDTIDLLYALRNYLTPNTPPHNVNTDSSPGTHDTTLCKM